MKKLLALLLVLSMMLAMLVACNNGGKEPEETTPPPSSNPKDDDEEEETFDITEILPSGRDYKLAEVKLCVRGNTEWDIGLKEPDGTPLTEALYERTARTEERLKVALEMDVVENHSAYNNAVKCGVCRWMQRIPKCLPPL